MYMFSTSNLVPSFSLDLLLAFFVKRNWNLKQMLLRFSGCDSLGSAMCSTLQCDSHAIQAVMLQVPTSDENKSLKLLRFLDRIVMQFSSFQLVGNAHIFTWQSMLNVMPP